MRVITEIYKVYDQDIEGRDRHAYHFTEVVDACAFAVSNEGLMAYHLPTVVKVTTTYDTKDLHHCHIDECFYTLSNGEIRSYARELR